MDDSIKRAATHLEFALSHMKAALIYWQTEAGGREELRDLAERMAILIDEAGPINGERETSHPFILNTRDQCNAPTTI